LQAALDVLKGVQLLNPRTGVFERAMSGDRSSLVLSFEFLGFEFVDAKPKPKTQNRAGTAI